MENSLRAKFAQQCAQHLKIRYGREKAVERLQERIENGPVEDRTIYVDILAVLHRRNGDCLWH